MRTGTNIAGFCNICNTLPCVCRQPSDGRVDHYHYNVPALGASQFYLPFTLEDIRRVVREELERLAVGKSSEPEK